MSLMTLKIGLSVTKLCVQLQLIIFTPNGWLVEIRQTNPGGKAGGSQGECPRTAKAFTGRQNFHVGVAAPSLRKLR